MNCTHPAIPQNFPLYLFRPCLILILWCAILGAATGSAHADWSVVFPQFGSGGGWGSDFFITNQGTQGVTNLELDFIPENGFPVQTNLGTSLTFKFSLLPGETKIIRTVTTGALQVGSAFLLVPGNVAIRCTAVFRRVENGVILTELGVPPQKGSQHYSFSAEVNTSQQKNTGIALANVDDTSQDVVINAIRGNGTVQGTTSYRLAGYGHTSLYLNELFPGLDNFAGSVSISAPGIIGVLALKQDQGVFGSVSVDEGPIVGPFLQTTSPVMESEPNNTTATARRLTGPAVVAGVISSSTDVDYFRFYAVRGDVVTVFTDTTDFDSPLDSLLSIEDAGGTLLAENDQNGLDKGTVDDAFLQLVIPANGYYFIRLTDYWNSGSAGYIYRLHVIVPALAPGGPMP